MVSHTATWTLRVCQFRHCGNNRSYYSKRFDGWQEMLANKCRGVRTIRDTVLSKHDVRASLAHQKVHVPKENVDLHCERTVSLFAWDCKWRKHHFESSNLIFTSDSLIGKIRKVSHLRKSKKELGFPPNSRISGWASSVQPISKSFFGDYRVWLPKRSVMSREETNSVKLTD